MLKTNAIVDKSGKIHLLDREIDPRAYGLGEPQGTFLLTGKGVGNKLARKGLAG